MGTVGQRERETQNRVVRFFQNKLGYDYLGNWQDREHNRNIETDLLVAWLQQRGVSSALINRALRQLDAAAALGEGKQLYYANKEVYRLLRYGVKDQGKITKALALQGLAIGNHYFDQPVFAFV